MTETQYTSTLTGPELDEALRDAAGVDAKVEQAQSAAQQAAQSAASAQGYASAASGSASQASTSAGQAAESAADASGLADAAAASARQAAASAASIEGDVEQASSSASAAAQSATQASGSASAAAQFASAAADSEDSVQQNAAAAQRAAAAASQSKSDAEAAASNAASSASTAQQAASLIEENLSAIQAAPSNAQAAQQAAAQAAASASAAEDAAERAEQIADFNPADFATSAQGTKADTAVQSVNGKTGTAITLGAADVGAATAAQGSLAETAVQPAALDAYALKTDVPDTPADIGAATAAQGAKADTAVQSVNGAKPDSSGNVQLDLTTGTVRSVNGKDPDGSGNVQLSAGDVGAATAAQGAKADTALQPGALNGYAQTSDIPSKLPNPQSLGIRLGQDGSTTYYDGSAAETVTITPESIGAQAVGTGGAGGTSIVTGETKTFNWENGKVHEELIRIDVSFSFAFVSLALSPEDAFAFLQNASGNVGLIASEAPGVGGTKSLDVLGYNGSGIDLTDCKIQYMYIPSDVKTLTDEVAAIKKAVESGSTVVPEPEPGQTGAEDDPIDAVRGMVYTTESNSKEEKYGVGNQALKRRNST